MKEKRVARDARTTAQYEAYRQIQRAAEEMERDFVELLKAHSLSTAQYNVLRILRGADGTALSCSEIASRLIRHDPDITRLLDRLEQRQLVARARCGDDRRVVRTRITSQGEDLLALLDKPVDAVHEEQLGHLSLQELTELGKLVDAARNRK